MGSHSCFEIIFSIKNLRKESEAYFAILLKGQLPYLLTISY